MLTAAEVSAAAQQVSEDPVGSIGACVFVLIVGAVVWWLVS